MTDPPSRQPIYYGWIVVAVAMIALLSVFGIRSAPAVLIKPLEDEFVWSRSQISAAIAVGLVCTGLAAPFGGALMDRIGPRRVLTASMALIGVSVMLATRMTEFWQFVLLWGVLSGLGSGALAGLGPTIAYRWFIERRGLVQGLFGALRGGSGLCAGCRFQNVGTIYGWVFCAHQIGAALAAQAGGLVHDYLGDYTIAFLFAGALAVVGGLMALRIDRTPLPEPVLAPAAATT